MTDLFDFCGAAGNTIAWEKSFWLNEQRIADSFGVELSPRLQDLLTLAMATYVADRRAIRPPASLGLWRRQLAIRVSVYDTSFWSRGEVHRQLIDFLEWLTDDDWEFDFVARDATKRSSQGHIFTDAPRSPARVALFSGGLDSLAGAAIDLHSRRLGELVLVAASSNAALRHVQSTLVQRLRTFGPIRHVNVPLNLIHRVAGTKDEPTQRSRGFLYVSLGAVVADLARLSNLCTYENGIGGLNLPYVESQIGAQASRSVHPKTLRMAGSFVQAVLGRPFSFESPFGGLTKGEACARIPIAARGLIVQSVSCDGFPSRIEGRRPCGACTSCLLRRQALHAAGLSGVEPAGHYRADVPGSRASDQALENLHDMLGQASRLGRLTNDDNPWSALTLKFPALTAVDDPAQPPLLREATRKSVIELLRRYADEWRSFPSSISHLYIPNDDQRRLASV